MAHENISIRFWDKVDIKSIDACWIWKANTINGGYGQFTYYGDKVPAHRVAWELSNNKKIPSGMYVLHKCDNPPCCNPNHLYCGTQSDNMSDRELRNPGSSGRISRLGSSNIILLRSMYKSGKYTQKELAGIFSLSEGYVSRLINHMYGDHSIKVGI